MPPTSTAMTAYSRSFRSLRATITCTRKWCKSSRKRARRRREPQRHRNSALSLLLAGLTSALFFVRAVPYYELSDGFRRVLHAAARSRHRSVQSIITAHLPVAHAGVPDPWGAADHHPQPPDMASLSGKSGVERADHSGAGDRHPAGVPPGDPAV